MKSKLSAYVIGGAIMAAGLSFIVVSCATPPTEKAAGSEGFGNEAKANADRLFNEGREIFRFDTFGSEAFWGGQVKLHQAIAGAKNGGVGPGLSPKQALDL